MKPVKNNIKNIYPMTAMQSGMLFLSLKETASSAYMQQISWRLRGDFDAKLFEKSWNELIRRHDILRTIFAYSDCPVPLQVVAEYREISCEILDFTAENRDVQDQKLQSFKEQQRQHVFDLEHDVLLRIHVVQLSERDVEIILTHHHIIMDGWSLGNLVKEALDIYVALRNQQPLPVPHTASFRDYVVWLNQQDEDEAISFWQGYLADYDQPALPLPKISPSVETMSQKRDMQDVSFQWDQAFVGRLTQFARDQQVTLNIVLQAIWGVLLSRYNNTNDIVFGNVVSGRPHEVDGIENMAGIFINTIPVRVQFQDGMSLAQLLETMQQEALLAKPYHHTSLSEVQKLTPLKDRLLGSLFVMENYPLDDLFELGEELPGTGFAVQSMQTWEDTHFDFGLRFLPDDGLKIKFGFNAARYEHATMERVRDHFCHLACEILKLGAKVALRDLEIVGQSEKEILLGKLNDTYRDFPTDKSIVELFKERVERSRDENALTVDGKTYSFEDLDHLSNRVCVQILSKLDIQRDDRIALYFEPSVWTVVSILGVLKAGAAYVPIDVKFPKERLNYVLADSQAQAILYDGNSAKPDSDLSLEQIDVSVTNEDYSARAVEVKSQDLAYIIYTSGSTGNPKGVMVEHQSVVNLTYAMQELIYARFNRPLKTQLLTTYVFDGSVHQIFVPLLHGHHLHVVDEDVKRDPQKYKQFCIDHQIDVGGCIPNFLALLQETGALEELKQSLNHMNFGGEPLPVHLLNDLMGLKGDLSIANLYGPTECCVNALALSTDQPVENPLTTVPIGHPIGNMQAHILDQWGHLAPLGAVGELCISGVGVARGYLNNPELTAQKFIEHPLVPNQRLYKTGDLARWNDKGQVEFLGRNDHQVKIMGYRIEPEEIEEKLLQNPMVREASVVPLKDKDGRFFLRACVCLDQAYAVNDIKKDLAAKVPRYMVPAQFMVLDELPLLISGKIDRKALMALEYQIDTSESDDIVEATTPLEEILLNVWRDVFGRENIGVEDDYFDLGGDSIRAIQIMSKLYNEGLKVEIKELFEYTTIKQLAPFARTAHVIEEEKITGDVVLTPIQQRFLSNFEGHANWFNHAILLTSQQAVNVAAVATALKALAQHHDVFRVRFLKDDQGNWRQNVDQDMGQIAFSQIAFEAGENDKVEIERIASELHSSLDIENGPLARAACVKGTSGEHLILVVHHLIVDGVSWRILLEDFNQAYEQAFSHTPIILPKKTHSIQHWGKELKALAQSEIILGEQDYWSQVENAKFCDFPVDHPDGLNRFRDIQTLNLMLSSQVTNDLLGPANKAYHTKSEDLLLITLTRALKKWKNLERTALTLEGHGREDVVKEADIHRTVGWFTSAYPVVLEGAEYGNLPRQIKQIKEGLRAIPNKGFGYGVLKYLSTDGCQTQAQKDVQAPLTFNYMGQFDAGDDQGRFRVSTEGLGGAVHPDMVRRAELDIGAMVMNDEMEISISFSQQRFDEATIQALLNDFHDELNRLCTHCLSLDQAELTPADLTVSDLSLDELEGLFEE